MGFLFSMDLFLGGKGLWQQKSFKRFLLHPFLHTGTFAIVDFFCLLELSFLDLDCLYLVAVIPHMRRIGGEEGS